MSYEVCPGQLVICGPVRYPEGSLVPTMPGIDELLELGIVREAAEKQEKPRPKPVKKEVLTPPHAGFDPADPSTVLDIPLRLLSDCLATVSDVDALKAMHAVEKRKGGLDRIEERIGELTA